MITAAIIAFIPSVMTPKEVSRNTAMKGTIMTPEICSATRGSFTHEDMKMANMADMTERMGPSSRIPTNQVGLST